MHGPQQDRDDANKHKTKSQHIKNVRCVLKNNAYFVLKQFFRQSHDVMELMMRNDTSVTDPTHARINQDLRPLSQKTIWYDVNFVFLLYFCQSRNVIAEFRLLQDRPESLSSVDMGA